MQAKRPGVGVWSGATQLTRMPSGASSVPRVRARLATPASRLRREHSDILATIVRAEKRLVTPETDVDLYVAWAEDLRVELTALLAALARHRQRGADLVYEAYAVDLGGG